MRRFIPPEGLERRSVNVRLSEGLWRWARIAAIDRDVTTSAIVELALERLRAEQEDGAA